MKKFLSLVLLSLVLFTACQKEQEKDKVITAENVTIAPNTLSLIEGEIGQLQAVVLPETTQDKTITWSSTKEAIATVTQEGKITAISEGTTDIIALTSNGKQATCKLMVTKKIIHVESISINPLVTITDDNTKKFSLNINVLPENASDKSFTYSVSEEGFISINKEDNTITGIKAGKTIITVKSTDSDKTAICIVTIVPKYVKATSVVVEDNPIMKVGTTKTLTVIVLPEEATNKTIEWWISDTSIASIDINTGLITALKEGKVTVKAIQKQEMKIGVSELTVIANGPTPTTFTDSRDGQVYKTVMINGVEWMAENLRYLPKVNKHNYFKRDEACYYVYDYNGEDVEEARKSEQYKKSGAMYNWEALKTIAPEGWRVTFDYDWIDLEKFYGLTNKEAYAEGWRGDFADKLKSKDYWTTPGTNESGISIVPGGKIGYGFPANAKDFAGYWTNTEDMLKSQAMYRGFSNDKNGIEAKAVSKMFGYSVRCVRIVETK